MRFSKWHALGNAYLLVERGDLPAALVPDEVRRLCDPNYGIGADGILEVTDIREPRPTSSSGTRTGRAPRSRATGRGSPHWLARRSGVAFPRVRLERRRIPARVSGDEVEVDLGLAEVGAPEPIEVGGERLEFTPVSVGNPPPSSGASRSAMSCCGSALVERHRRFPERTNVQLVRADSPGDLSIVVWERGPGETLASGSSAAAAAAA